MLRPQKHIQTGVHKTYGKAIKSTTNAYNYVPQNDIEDDRSNSKWNQRDMQKGASVYTISTRCAGISRITLAFAVNVRICQCYKTVLSNRLTIAWIANRKIKHSRSRNRFPVHISWTEWTCEANRHHMLITMSTTKRKTNARTLLQRRVYWT